MTWIETIGFKDAVGKLRGYYDRMAGPGGNVDNIMLAHSLRPHTLEGHMTLYKHVLHHPKNCVPKWFLEAIGVHVSLLNHCDYCVEHHHAGMVRLIGDEPRAAAIRAALETGRFSPPFSPAEAAALDYARKLTERPAAVGPDDIEALRAAGWDDGEILEINQVTAYFGYANRTVLGLGVDRAGDVLGLSPDGGEEDEGWRHG